MTNETDECWDAIVIGAGMGGSTVGYSLARQGLRVLFLEQGLSDVKSTTGVNEDAAERYQSGRWPDRIITEIDGRVSEPFAPLGTGAGGSTLLFGAALERFMRSDFDDAPELPHPTGGWPVSYDEFAPWYEQAEALFNVRGTRDPLADPVPATMRRAPPAREQDQIFMREFAALGLHPYRLHVGMAYKPGCKECLGHACLNRCKSDARTICLEPAISQHGATLRDRCEVTRIIADSQRADAVEYRRDGETHIARGRTIILSAGTYRSAPLLLRSVSPDWPNGIGNRHDLVGRNLAFHSSDWFTIWPQRNGAKQGPRKSIGLRDFYAHDGKRLGQMQSTGLDADYGNVLTFLYQEFDRSIFRHLFFIRPFLRIPAKIASKLFGTATTFAIIIEDFGDPENRLIFDPERADRIIVRYRTSEDLKARTMLARQLIRSRLSGYRKYWLRPDLMIDLGHPTGTCRFGRDPATSVLNADCRVHDLSNLYVVDGSFMPSSAGTNPGLTIAANGLRVGEAIVRQLRESPV